jgi:hypothetical protein
VQGNLTNGDITARIDPGDGMGGLNDMGRFGNKKGVSIREYAFSGGPF